MGKRVSTSRARRLLLGALAAGLAPLLLIPGGAHAATIGLPSGKQVNDDPSAGIDPARSVSGEDPANADVAGGTLTAGGAAVPWAIFRQQTASKDQVFSRSFAGGAWTTRGRGTVGGRSSASATFPGSLNFDQASDGEAPAIDFAGAGRNIPWATWYENTSGPGFDSDNIFASRFDPTTDKWIFAGQGRGLGGGSVQVPSLNVHPTSDAENPSVAGGTTVPGGKSGPWITWQEVDGHDQIFVVKPIGPNTTTCPVGTKPTGVAPVGGFCWQQVGTERVNSADPSLNVDRTRDGVEPDIAFTGPNDTVPWVVWYETGASGVAGLHNNELVFAAKGVADGSADGGFHWQVVGAATAGHVRTLDNSSTGGPCTAGASPNNGIAEAACALNKNGSDDAEDPRIAAGTMSSISPTVPWIAWTENVAGTHEIFVARLVSGDHFEVVNHGKPISSTSDPSIRPDISFSGHTPYVSWLTNTGGVEGEFIGHFVNATNPTFVPDNGPLRVSPTAIADVRAPISSACTDTPFNSDGAHCQGGALGTPFTMRTHGTSVRALLADAYQPAKPVTRRATHIRVSSARVHGSVNPVGAALEARFDFGRTTSYGRHTAFHHVSPTNVSRAIRARLPRLRAGKRVHFRIEVRTDFGVLVGGDRTFKTLRATRLRIGHARAIARGTRVSVATTLRDSAIKKPLAGRRVKLFVRHSRAGSWVRLAARTTNHRGHASVKQKPRRFTQYEWRFSGDRSHGPAVSAIQSFTIK
jgi:hypothetical protein